MKKNILIFALLIFSISHSQIQTVFYVDDVKVIDYVTINFCVNDSARISQVSVLKEQTTYKNEVIIDRLVKYLKRVQYYPDSKLKNNCYDSTFKFVNKDYENAELKPSDYPKCKAFKTGDFTYSDFRHKGTKITRRKRKQREKIECEKKRIGLKKSIKLLGHHLANMSLNI